MYGGRGALDSPPVGSNLFRFGIGCSTTMGNALRRTREVVPLQTKWRKVDRYVQERLKDDETGVFENSLRNLSLAVSELKKIGPASDLEAFGLPIAYSNPPGHTAPAEEQKPTRSRTARKKEAEGEKTPPMAAKDGSSSRRTKEIKMAAARGTGTAPAQAAGAYRKETKTERRDRVVMEHLPLVKAIAVRVHESLPVHVELDDLVHAGILGLFDAATKFNPDKQVAFSSYAKHRIKGAILDSLRQLDWASRDMRRRHKQVEQVTRDLYALLQRMPTDEEVAEKMGVEVEKWRQMALDLRNVGLISASTRPSEQDELPAPDFPTTEDLHPDSICQREQMREKLAEAMSILPERYQKVVTLYYTNEMTMKEIGGILGINESRVSQIHKSALEKMAVVLQGNGITSAAAF